MILTPSWWYILHQMTKVIVDNKKIEKFLTRGVYQIFPSINELRKKLQSGERIRVYQGFDPTGPYLHVGHAIGIRALRILQELGHEVIFLVGDFTARVGDPDKDTTRKLLTQEEVEANMAGWKQQASKLIDFEGENPVIFKGNFEWLSKLNLKDLIELMSHATVQQMIERDNFKKRLENNNPIQLQEFIYPLLQGYDSMHLQVDLQIGGTDQIFNMLVSRDIVKAYLNKEMFVRAHVLMDAPNGKTMSKTKGNGINLSDPPEIIYGKAMSYDDEHILIGLELLTDTPEDELQEIKLAMKRGENPIIYKKLMARRIVETIYGTELAIKAEKSFELTFQRKELTQENTKPIIIEDQTTLLDFLKKALGASHSSSEIKRVISQGGVEVNGIKVYDPNFMVKTTDEMVIKFGKKDFFRPVKL